MYSFDDDKLKKHRRQVKTRILRRVGFMIALCVAASLVFVFSGADSTLVTAAAHYHPKVMGIHRMLNNAAHQHLNVAQRHLHNHAWTLSPKVSKLRGSSTYLHHISNRHPAMTQHTKKAMAPDTNAQTMNTNTETTNTNAETQNTNTQE